jgi:penicillin-binding protein-related factor A (putative recombinase)
MPTNYGKAFETKLKEDFLKVDGSTIDRLRDPVGGFHGISNVSDFIGYIYPNIFYLECKSHNGNTFPLANLTQFDKLKEKVGIPGVRAGVVIWFIEHKKVIYVPISTFIKLKEDEKKSFNIKMLGDSKYFSLEIPGKIKRLFIDTDYSIVKNLKDGQ